MSHLNGTTSRDKGTAGDGYNGKQLGVGGGYGKNKRKASVLSKLKGPPMIHICYTPEYDDTQLLYMARSIKSIVSFASPKTRRRLVFHIFGQGKLWLYMNNRLDRYLAFLGNVNIYHPKRIPQVKLYTSATRHVTDNRKVWGAGMLQKLAKKEVYIRFYIPQLIEQRVDKYLYLDTDTVALSDVADQYDAALSSGEYTMAAGVQNPDICTLGKMMTINDTRIADYGIKYGDECLSGGAFYVDRWRWLKENRTERWQFWVEENAKQKLYYLGCMPPQMIDFHKQWQQLAAESIRDWKKLECCPPRFGDQELLTKQTAILHPIKKLRDPGIFRKRFAINISGKSFIPGWDTLPRGLYPDEGTSSV